MAAKGATSPVGRRKSSGGTGGAGAGGGTRPVALASPARGPGGGVAVKVTLTGGVVVVGSTEPPRAAPQLGADRHRHRPRPV